MQQRTIAILSLALFALSLVWGAYTLLVYMGIPVHNLVYVTNQENVTINEQCDDLQVKNEAGAVVNTPIRYYLCRGSMAIVPFVKNFVLMSRPFYPYIIVSVILLLAITGFGAYRHGSFSYSLKAAPWMLIATFALSVWLIGTTFSLGSIENAKDSPKSPPAAFNVFYEPSTLVYSKIGEEGLNELKANFEHLKARGCLKEYGTAQNGAMLYTLSALCMQSSLFARAGFQLLLLLLFFLNILIAGSGGMWLLEYRAGHTKEDVPLLAFLMTLGLGIIIWIAALWMLSLGGWLQGAIVRTLFFGLPIIAYRYTWRWLKAAFMVRWPITISFSSVTLLCWLLISYLALNFLNVVRPFPIGWDDLGSYLNVPRLLASYGSFLPSLSQFRWEYLSSLGYILFGITPDSGWDVIGATFAMQINWSSGLLGVLVSYAFGRLFFGRGFGFLTAIMYYCMPMVGHFSFADMKIDNAVYFSAALSLLCASIYLFGTPGLEGTQSLKGDRRLLIVAGIMAGLGFGFKSTAILSILMVISLIASASLGVFGFVAITALSFLIMSAFGPLDFRAIGVRVSGVQWDQQIAQSILLVIALASFGMTYVRRKLHQIQVFGSSIGMLVLGIAIACAPWMIVNASTNGWSLTPGAVLQAANPTAIQIMTLTKEQSKNMALTGNIRYLPEELKLDPEHPACKTSAKVEELDRYWGYGSGVSHYLTLPWRQVMNIDSFGYYVTYVPILLLIPLILLLPYVWRREGRWLRIIFAVTMVYLCQWILVGNGIGWYGIGMFIGFSVLLEAMVARAPDAPNRILWNALITASILICLINRLWQFDSQRNIFEYPLGKVSASALREMTIPEYDDIAESIIERQKAFPEQPFTYRMGTFISYFVPKNREVLPIADNQLTQFHCLNQERNHPLTLKRLKALGFNGMIFDTNTSTIEADPKGPLHEKVNVFLDFAADPAIGLQAAVNNPDNGIIYLLFPGL